MPSIERHTQATIFDQFNYVPDASARTGEEMEQRAREWIRANHAAYLQMLYEANRCANENRPTSIAKLVEEVRYSGKVNYAPGEDFKIDNSLRAPLARIMIKTNPRLEGVIKTRKSKTDGILV